MTRHGTEPADHLERDLERAHGRQAGLDRDRRQRLLRLAGPDGIIAGLAIDHRDSLRVYLERQGLAGLTTAELGDLKAALVRVLAPAASTLMLDAELGQAAFDSGAVPPSIGLIMPIEAQGYEVVGDGRLTTLLADWEAIAPSHHADACKLLLPYRVDHEPSAARQDALVAGVAQVCHGYGLPLVIEPVAYQWSSESAADYALAYEALVIGAVARLQPLGADLLKVPFPLPGLASAGEDRASEACRALAGACAGTPWVLLGAGVGIDEFVDQVRLAGRAGASGFLAGRGIWGPALSPDPAEAERLARAVALPAFERCRDTAHRFAQPLRLAPVD